MHFLPLLKPLLTPLLHLPCVLQKDLFVSKVEPTSPRNERKFSAATAPSMKTKWLKAFKSLKPAGSGSAQQADRWVRHYIYHPNPPGFFLLPTPPIFPPLHNIIGHREQGPLSRIQTAAECLELWKGWSRWRNPSRYKMK